MALTILQHDETNDLLEEKQTLVEALLQKASQMESITDEAEVSVTYVDDSKIQAINRDYRGIDKPTDVISFALEEEEEGELEIIDHDEPRILGDIIISIPRTEEQAARFGHPFDRELGFLAVHGFLHLLGYDHMTDADEKEMFERQEEILEAYGLQR